MIRIPNFTDTQPSTAIVRKDRNTSKKTEVEGGNFLQHIKQFGKMLESLAITIRLLNTELSAGKIGTDDAQKLCSELACYDVLRSIDGIGERNAGLVTNGYNYQEIDREFNGKNAPIAECVDNLIRKTKSLAEGKDITEISLNDIHGGGISPELITRLVGYYNRALHTKNEGDNSASIPQDFFDSIYSNGWFSTSNQDQKAMTKKFTEYFGQWLTKAGVSPENVGAIKKRFQENYIIDAKNNNGFVCRSLGPKVEVEISNALFKKESDCYSFAIDFSNTPIDSDHNLHIDIEDNNSSLLGKEQSNKDIFEPLSSFFRNAFEFISQCFDFSGGYSSVHEQELKTVNHNGKKQWLLDEDDNKDTPEIMQQNDTDSFGSQKSKTRTIDLDNDEFNMFDEEEEENRFVNKPMQKEKLFKSNNRFDNGPTPPKELKQLLDKKNNENQNLVKQNKVLESKLSALTKKLEDKESKIAQLRTAQQKNSNNDSEQSSSSSSSRVPSPTINHNANNLASSNQIQEHEKLVKKNKELSTLLINARNEIEQAKKSKEENSELNLQINALQQQMSAMKNNAENANVVATNKLKEVNQKLESQANEFAKEKEELQAKLENSFNEINTLKENLEVAVNEKKFTDKVWEKSESKKEQLESQVAELQQQIDTANKNKSENDDLNKMKKELAQLKEGLEAQSKEFAEVTNENLELKAKNKELTKSLNDKPTTPNSLSSSFSNVSNMLSNSLGQLGKN